MIRMKNIVAQGGYNYSKYLKKQLAEVMENAHVHKQYNMADLHVMQDQSNLVVLEDGTVVPIENLQKYTRITGDLFERWGLTKENYLTDAKIDQVCAIELGEDERTAGQIKPVLRNYKTVMGAEGYPVEVHQKDIKNGYYVDEYGAKIHFKPNEVTTKSGFKKKTAIEIVFSHDQSFSHAGALMDEADQVKLAQLWMDCAEASYKECFTQYLETYHGVKGETGASLYFHNDARSGNVHHHVHLNISNVIRLEDGTVMSIEMPAMRQKNFHQAMDAMFKNMFVAKWQEQFGEKYPVEAYDKERQSIKADDKFQMQDIENHRVAFTDDILEAIRLRSKSKELIDKAISQQKRDCYEKSELKRMAVQEKFDALEAKLKDIDLPTNYGVIVSHGAAPYQNDPKQSMSYFVELELANGKTKKIWAKDIENAIAEKDLKVGDFAGFSQTGETQIKVKDANGNWVNGVRKSWEATDLKNYKSEMEALADLDGQIKAINRAEESALRTIESPKNRDAVWMTIKQKKKAIGKELKDVELHKEAVQLGSTIKDEKERGAVYMAKDDEAILDKLTDTNPFFTKYDLIIELSKHYAMGSKADEIAEQKLKEWADTGLLVSEQIKPKEDAKPKRKKTFSKQSAQKKEAEYPMQHTTKKLARMEYMNVKTSTKLVENMTYASVQEWRKHVADAIKAQPKGRRFNGLQVELMKAVVEKEGSRLVLCEGFPRHRQINSHGHGH
ncbi:relaxase domain-containing protein [Serratia marcescens]|uniref:relaxase domain-containing protein n=1 Tax=Serratia marcescens TaxID=615 RepID=UPI001F14BA3D|nr:relaxase domain-containing protein [Serratia marcescens]